MAIAETARLIASLELQDKLSKPADKAIGKVGKLEGSLGKLGSSAKRGIGTAAKVVAATGAVAAGFVAVQVSAGLDSLAQLEDATSAVDAAIKATGQTGKIAAKQVAGWANEIEASVEAAFDDKDITRAASTLLRFGKVSAKNLRPALEVMTDLAVKTGSVDSAATLLARALADPAKAAGKLSRAGVILTKTQQDQIKALVKAGKVEQAQAVILGELSKATAGAAKASAGPYRDSLNILADVTEDAQRALAEGFLPVITKVRDILSKELAKPEVIQGIRDFGKGVAGGLDSLINIATKVPWGAIGQSLKIAGTGAKAVLDAFLGLPPWIQTAVITGWGLNKLSGGALGSIVGELGKGLIKGVLGMTAGVVNIKAATVTGTGGLPGAAGAAGGGAGLAEKVGAVAAAAIGAEIIDAAHDFGSDAGKSLLDTFLPGMPQAGEAFARVFGAQASLSIPGFDALQHLGDIPDQFQQFTDFLGGKVDVFGNKIDQSAMTASQDADRVAKGQEAVRASLTRAIDSESTAVSVAIRDGLKDIHVATKEQVAQFRRVEARLAKEQKDPFRFIKQEAAQGDAKGGILPTIASLVRSFTEGRSPWANDLKVMKGHLQNLKDAEAAFRAKGDTKTADAIKGQIKVLQGVVDSKQSAANAKLDKIVANTAPKQGKILPGDTRSESSGTRLNASPESVKLDTSPIVTAVTSEGGKTRTTITTSGAATAAAAAALKTTIQAGDTRSEGALSRLSTSTSSGLATVATAVSTSAAGAAAANATQDAATRAVIQAGDTRSEGALARLTAATGSVKATVAAGDTRSEAAMSRINAATGAVRSAVASGLSATRGAVNGVATAVRNKDLSTTVNVTVPVSVRAVTKGQTKVTKFSRVTINP